MKQFEEEYKEYVNGSAPDLWERIEAGVDQKIAQEDMRQAQKQKKSSQKMIRMWGSIAACVAAIALIVPVYRFVNPNKDVTMQEDATQMAVVARDDIEMEQATEDAVKNEQNLADAMPIDTSDEMETEEASEVETIEYAPDDEELFPLTETNEESEQTEENTQLASSVTNKEASQDSLDEEQGNKNQIEEEDSISGMLVDEKELIILALVERTWEEEDGRKGYQVEVLRDESGRLGEAVKLTLWSSSDGEALLEGSQCELKITQIDFDRQTAKLLQVLP